MIANMCIKVIEKQYNSMQNRLYTKLTSLLVPAESVRGMTCLDRSAFATTVELPFMKFHCVKISKVIPVLKKYLFKIKKFKPVQRTEESTVVYLNPALIKSFDDFKEDERKQLSQVHHSFGIEKVPMTYNNWSSYDILRAILPEEIDVPTSSSIVGHIVHLNLREKQLPYKNVIGQVYLDTIPTARTIVNKTSDIDMIFRNFKMEILAGDNDTLAIVKENGCTYELDFSKVYWNTRLGTEHRNVVAMMKPNDVLYDMFAGVGPFAVPAARKGMKVFANDLNPESYKWLLKNIVTNKVQKSIQCYNMDGRDFLRTVFKEDILKRRTINEDGTEHIVMNLPAIAVEFLDVFFDSFEDAEIQQICSKPPIIHLYCFVKATNHDDACKLGQQLVERKLGSTLSSDSLINLHYVRNVSLNTEMIRVSFLLTRDLLKSEKEPAMKRLKSETSLNVSGDCNVVENNGKD